MGRRSASGISQSQFQNPLLAAMYKKAMSDGMNYVGQTYESAILATCGELGFSRDAFGNMPSNPDRAMTDYWIGNAFRALVDQNLCDSKKKGHWQLTAVGLDYCNRNNVHKVSYIGTIPLPGATGPVTIPMPNPVPVIIHNLNPSPNVNALPQTVVAAPAPIEPPTETVMTVDNIPAPPPAPVVQLASIQAKPVLTGEIIYQDPYLRGLAIASTACYGNFSGRSEECGKCALQGSCRDYFFLNLPVVAKSIIEEANKPKEIAPPPEAKPPEAKPVENKSPATAVSDKGYISKTCPVNVVCTVCRNDIPKGDPSYWKRGHGFIHTGCFAKAP